jgi:hypothetical protein
MLRIKLTSSLFTILIFFSACSQVKPIPQHLPSPSSKWMAKLNKSGGLSGVLLSVEISSDGGLKAEDQRSGRTVSQTLPLQTTAKLNQLISTTAVASRSVPQSECADCFIYDLEIQSEEGDLHIHTDDVTLKDSGAADLITYMSKLRDDALGSNP